MTPRKLNPQIRDGEVFYLVDPNAPHDIRKAKIVKQARTKRVNGVRKVQVKTVDGWEFAEEIRRSGSNEMTTLDGEGLMTAYLN